MGKYIIDLETDGLLDTITKIHVLGWHNLDTGKSGEITDYEQMKRFLLQDDLTLICHNISRFDSVVWKKILGVNKDIRLIDTLILSWYLEPERNSHGLDNYGAMFGIPKPKVTDWTTQPIEVYINRVREDVKINLSLFNMQITHLRVIYDNDDKQIKRFIGYLMYKMDCAREQEEMRWKLDIPLCNSNLNLFETEFETRKEILVDIMPEKINYKSIHKPKKFLKRDNTVSKLGENWLSLLDELGLDEDFEGPLKIEKNREPGNPNSPLQLKNWFYSLGWIPVTFKYEKEDDGSIRKIEQMSLPRGEGLCPSIKLLYEVEPTLEQLDMYYVIKHRIGLLKGFLRDVDEEGFLQAKIAGITNTLRFKHSIIVNLPKPTGKNDWRDGVHIRGCLVAEEGYVLCGSDMSSLEDRTKQHYIYFFDPEYVEVMNVPGFDPHLDLAELGYEVTNGEMGLSIENIEWFKLWNHDAEYSEHDITKHTIINKERSNFKTVNYGAVYGVGELTMSRTTGMPVRQCATLLKIYWKKNWSVKEIAKACITKEVGTQMWLYNPVSKFWYSLRFYKDRFSTLNQGTGVYAFDRWVKNCRDEGVKMCGQFHDEVVAPVVDDILHRTVTTNILKNAVAKVNEELKLNRALDIDVQFGHSYADVH